MLESSMVRRDDLPTPRITVCALLYGNYPGLATRCLNSIRALPGNIEFRIGLNDVSDATRVNVLKFFNEENEKRNVLLYDSSTNRGKYPVMRWMLHDPTNAVISPYVMWFDDDSYLLTPTEAWLTKIEQVMADADICGQLMTTPLTVRQAMWVQLQPWYHGRPMRFGNPTTESTPYYGVGAFPVGGWWTIRTSILNRLDWPPLNIVHRGGDYMLGEALHQADLHVVQFAEGVAINADLTGASHKATRRGLNPPPVGTDFEPPLTAHLHLATKNIEPRLLDYPGL